MCSKCLFSVIVPVYNQGKYLRRCLDSIVDNVREAQKNDLGCSVEVICINDGSVDDTGEILNEYKRKFVSESVSLRIFTQENQGVSVARNLGLQQSNGEWCVFLDADDWWEGGLLCFLIENCVQDYDIVGYNLKCVDGNGCEHGLWLSAKVKGRVNKGFAFNLLGGSVWDKAIRMDIIRHNAIKFEKGMHIGEDSLFAKICITYSRQVYLDTTVVGANNFWRADSTYRNRERWLLEDPLLTFRVLNGIYIQTRNRYLLRELRYVVSLLPSLGVNSSVQRRNDAIDFLLGSQEFNSKVLKFMFLQGTWRTRIFGVAYLFPNRTFRRYVIRRMARFVAG